MSEMEIKATRPTMPAYEDYIQEIRSIWENGIMTNNGEKVKKFRDMLADFGAIAMLMCS